MSPKNYPTFSRSTSRKYNRKKCFHQEAEKEIIYNSLDWNLSFSLFIFWNKSLDLCIIITRNLIKLWKFNGEWNILPHFHPPPDSRRWPFRWNKCFWFDFDVNFMEISLAYMDRLLSGKDTRYCYRTFFYTFHLELTITSLILRFRWFRLWLMDGHQRDLLFNMWRGMLLVA